MNAQKDNEYKRNHYLAEMLSDRFADKDGKLYCCHQKEPKKIFRTTPKNVFLESDLYIQYDEHGKRDVSVEKGLSQLEGKANEVVEKIVSAARGGRNPGLTPDEKKYGMNLSVNNGGVCRSGALRSYRTIPYTRSAWIVLKANAARLLIMSAAGSMIQNVKLGY